MRKRYTQEGMGNDEVYIQFTVIGQTNQLIFLGEFYFVSIICDSLLVPPFKERFKDCGWEEKMDIREKGRDWKGIAMDIDREKRKKEVSMKGREILQRRTEEMEKDINAKITEIER